MLNNKHVLETRRLKLHKILKRVLGSENVYFQPPESLKMSYPAIVYKRDDIQNTFAENNVYRQERKFMITVIDPDPDSIIVEKVSKLPTARFDRHFTSSNLNHDIFTLFY